MKFIVSSSLLLKKIQLLSGVVNHNSTLPILQNFLFDIDKTRLVISASDMETTISTEMEVESKDKGKIAMSARMLLETIKTFPEQPLTFSALDGTNLEISANNGKYSLAYIDGSEYPTPVSLAEAQSTTIVGDVLATAIGNTLFAAGNDDLRPVMSGVFFQFSPEHMTLVATDAHKLVKYRRTDVTADEEVEFIMPKKPLNLLKGMLQGSETEVTIEYNESNARFAFDNTELICRLIDGKYPNYEAVIPKDNPNVLQIERAPLLSSVRRVSIFSNKTTYQIRLRLAGSELQISAEDVDYSNSADERLSCDYNGEDMQIGFNSRFLLEMLSNLTADEVSIAMSMPDRAGILTPMDGLEEGEELTMLVMPVMLHG